MGLDAVEIVMEVEEAFDITILDTEAEKVRTPRDLIELVMGKVGRYDVAVCLTQRAFHRLRKAFLSELNLKRADFHLDTPMDQLLPLATRKAMLPGIYQRAGVAAPPPLVRSRRLKAFLIVAGLVTGAGAATALALAPPGKSLLLNLSKQLYGLVGIAVAICGLCLGFRLTNKMTTAFPAELGTIRGHVRWLVANNPQLLGAPPGQWSRELVAEKVRGIVIAQLGVKNYREDARFVEDLGLG